MTFLDKLERRFAHFAIPGLIRYVVILNALVFILVYLNPAYISLLALDRTAIAQGQVWRLVSWIFIPETFSLIWIFCYLSFTWWLGDCLEATWGTFRLNIYYFLGMAGSIFAALIFGYAGGNSILNFTLLFAAATMAPNLEILLFYLIPVKLKWLAILGLIVPVYSLVFGSLVIKATVLVCLGNYLLFFGPTLFREAMHNRSAIQRRARFESAKVPAFESLHRCETCGITEISNPETDFRVAADGHEYCATHLPSKLSS